MLSFAANRGAIKYFEEFKISQVALEFPIFFELWRYFKLHPRMSPGATWISIYNFGVNFYSPLARNYSLGRNFHKFLANIIFSKILGSTASGKKNSRSASGSVEPQAKSYKFVITTLHQYKLKIEQNLIPTREQAPLTENLSIWENEKTQRLHTILLDIFQTPLISPQFC